MVPSVRHHRKLAFTDIWMARAISYLLQTIVSKGMSSKSSYCGRVCETSGNNNWESLHKMADRLIDERLTPNGASAIPKHM